MREGCFHSSDKQYKEYEKRSIDKAIYNETISKGDANKIREFLAEISSQNNISAQRKFKLATNLTNVFQHLPDAGEITIADVYQAVEDIKNATNPKTGKQYTRNTQSDLLRVLKRFCLWLCENGYSDMNIAKLKKIKVPAYISKTKSDDSILTEEEVLAVIQAPKSLRYRAMLGILYEGGFRIQEIAYMKWHDVRFTQWGARIRTDGKTEKERNVPIIMYRELLAQWQTEHPNPAPENYVFLNYHNKPLKYQSVLKNIREFCKAAEIERKITPHIFRHSRITHCLRRGMQETLCKKTFWGNESTDMLKVYSHLTPDDAEAAFAKMAGVEIADQEETTGGSMEPVQCRECTHINPPGTHFCGRCGSKLTAEATKYSNETVRLVEILVNRMPESERLQFYSEISNLQ